MEINLGRHSYTGGIIKVPASYPATLNVGNFTSIASNLTIITSQHVPCEHPEAVSSFPFNETFGVSDYHYGSEGVKIDIGSDVWICVNVTITRSLSIGNGAIIMAGAVLTKDVPPFAKVGGVPGRILRYRFTEEQIRSLEKISWWNWSDSEVFSALEVMKDINRFIAKYS